jgi:hypothetical protein
MDHSAIAQVGHIDAIESIEHRFILLSISCYEITRPFVFISLRRLRPFRALPWPCYFLTTAESIEKVPPRQ